MKLEEYAKITEIVSGCNDIINGKFILAYNKINTILKKIADSKEMYNLLANCLNNFDFDREFSRAQFRSQKSPSKFILPEEPEKLLPFVFCMLVNFNNHTLNLDSFLDEFFPNEEKNHTKSFQQFAKTVIEPFKNIVENYFINNKDEEEENMKKKIENEEVEQEEYEESPEDEEIEENDEEINEVDARNYAEITAEKVDEFLSEIKADCEQILAELPYEKRITQEVRDDIEYIVNTIINNCEEADLDNTIALITALDYLTPKAKNLKIYTREMKNVLINFYSE